MSQLSKTGKLIYPTLRCFATLQHDSRYPGELRREHDYCSLSQSKYNPGINAKEKNAEGCDSQSGSQWNGGRYCFLGCRFLCVHYLDYPQIVICRDDRIDDGYDYQPQEVVLYCGIEYVELCYEPSRGRDPDEGNKTERQNQSQHRRPPGHA